MISKNNSFKDITEKIKFYISNFTVNIKKIIKKNKLIVVSLFSFIPLAMQNKNTTINTDTPYAIIFCLFKTKNIYKSSIINILSSYFNFMLIFLYYAYILFATFYLFFILYINSIYVVYRKDEIYGNGKQRSLSCS